MNVYLFGYFDIPPNMAPVRRSVCLVKGLVASGVDVELDIIHSVCKEKPIPMKGEYDGFRYNFVNGEKHYSNGVQLRLDLKYRDLQGAVQYIKRNVVDGDIVYIYSGNSNDIKSLTDAAHKKNAKAVLELVEIPYYSNSISAKLKRWYQEKFVYPKLDGFSCISTALLDYAKCHASKTAKFINTPILVEANNQYVGEPEFEYPYIIHTGTMQERKDGISAILKAFSLIKKTDTTGCKLVFAGPQSTKNSSYVPMMKELGILDDVVLLGMIKDPRRLTTLQRYARMSIVYRFDNIQTRYGFSTKMGEVLMSGVPLITTPIGGQSDYLVDRQNAFLVEPGNVEQLADVIRYVLNHKEEASKIAQKGKQLADTVFSPQYQGERLSQYFRSL